ncbi:MAG: hypothetical protein JXA20_12670 [Spirochaetes bacterium]|nr:hypothetical protein [Spirochaetota bacterium]
MILGERVMAGIRSGEDNPMPVTAECGADILRAVCALCNAARFELMTASRDSGSMEHRILAELIRRLERVSIGNAVASEREPMGIYCYAGMLPGSIGTLGSHTDVLVLPGDAITVASSTIQNPTSCSANRAVQKPSAKYTGDLDVSGFLVDRTKADYYRLFLYLWEDSPWYKTTFFHTPAARGPSAIVLFYAFLPPLLNTAIEFNDTMMIHRGTSRDAETAMNAQILSETEIHDSGGIYAFST